MGVRLTANGCGSQAQKWENKVQSQSYSRPSSRDQRQTDVQALVVKLINRLLSVGISDVDVAITDCLRQLGQFAGRDRAYVFVRRDGYVDNTHEWCATGIVPAIEQLQGLAMEDFRALLDPLLKDQRLLLPDIRELPPESAEYEVLATQEIRSLLFVPMIDDGQFFGFVGFDSVSRRGDFLPGEIYLLKAFADVVRAVLVRRTATQAMRAAQEELARERAFLQGIVSTNASGFLVFDEDGIIIYANDAAEDVLGLPLDELLGQPFDSPNWRVTDLQGRRIESGQEPFARVRRTGARVSNHRIALHRDDGTRYASINAAPIAATSPGKTRVVYAVSEVTALVEAEQTREAALSAACRANEVKSNFLANMSHEIRTPLNGILGISNILADSLSDHGQKQMVQILQDSGNLLMSIIDDLLDMSKIEADALELEHIPFALDALTRRIEEVHTLRASDKGLSFSVQLKDPLGQERMGDPHRLMQIIHNLVSNAVKFTDAGFVRVRIDATHPGSILLCAEDSGIGMSAEHQAKVLEPFTQADTSISRRFGGTGLGMSIVKRLVEMMGGELDIESSEGVGTQMRISLPLAVTATSQTAPTISAPPAVLPDIPSLRVLAADDNRTNQMILGMMLGQLGAKVTMADDGLAALDLYRTDNFDLLLLDISMPKLDGVALLSTLRAIEVCEGRKRVPALAVTANAMTHQVQSYLDAGFDGCLTKPLRLERLREALSTITLTNDAAL